MFHLGLSLAADISVPKGAIVKKIIWNDKVAQKRFEAYFRMLINQPFDVLNLKIQTDIVSKELITAGYFSSSIKPSAKLENGEVVIDVNVVMNERINFEFLGNKIFSHQELKNKLAEKIKNDFGKSDPDNLGLFIAKAYETAGYFNTVVTNYQNAGFDLEKKQITNYYFSITEGKKIKVREILFRGNKILGKKELESLFLKKATALASAKYFDPQYFEEFTEILKKEYLSKGFVFIEISKPRIIVNEDDKSMSIEYGIVEKQQVLLRALDFPNIPKELVVGVKKVIVNQESAPVNIVELENDLRKMIVYFQNQGYYFASVVNLNSNTLLTYDSSFTYVDLKPEISLDKQVCYNETIINGNLKTNSIVINREIEFVEGELITPTKIDSLRQKLSGLNLFSSLKITPYMVYDENNLGCPKTNLVIQVKEKEFGLLEIAPGFRTDLGGKVSTSIAHNNLFGMNRSASLRLQGNKRFNLKGFDERRKRENKDLLEYSAKASFFEPYLFHKYLNTQLELELSSSFQRIRFYGFDADVFRISPQVSKTFTRWFSTSIKYQFESIIQFDATAVKDNDNFKIGGITPSLTFDFRDDLINPTKGAFFNLSSEWANTRFGSMKQSDLEVNFVKLISRNKFYYPVGDFVFALSIAGGFQKNFATEYIRDEFGNPQINSNGNYKTKGYIPSIKVFRLDSYDEIRGYDDGEINRLLDGREIGEVIVQDKAYFAALKFEPRYSLTDNLKVGVFFDAGRVFVNEFKPLKLRTSVGLGLKYVTPVGSLDFDYGFKLQRKVNPEGVRDSASRFHLSIGFF
jgi:outer membrane protein insertion porin family